MRMGGAIQDVNQPRMVEVAQRALANPAYAHGSKFEMQKILDNSLRILSYFQPVHKVLYECATDERTELVLDQLKTCLYHPLNRCWRGEKESQDIIQEIAKQNAVGQGSIAMQRELTRVEKWTTRSRGDSRQVSDLHLLLAGVLFSDELVASILFKALDDGFLLSEAAGFSRCGAFPSPRCSPRTRAGNFDEELITAALWNFPSFPSVRVGVVFRNRSKSSWMAWWTVLAHHAFNGCSAPSIAMPGMRAVARTASCYSQWALSQRTDTFSRCGCG